MCIGNVSHIKLKIYYNITTAGNQPVPPDTIPNTMTGLINAVKTRTNLTRFTAGSMSYPLTDSTLGVRPDIGAYLNTAGAQIGLVQPFNRANVVGRFPPDAMGE